MIIKISEPNQLLEDFITEPIYVKGYCWNRKFDGWTVIYRCEDGTLRFDYRGVSYPVTGFLPNKWMDELCSCYNNGFYINRKIEHNEKPTKCKGCDFRFCMGEVYCPRNN